MKIKNLFKKKADPVPVAVSEAVKPDDMDKIVGDIRLAVDDLKSYLLSRGITIQECPKDMDWNTFRKECEEIKESLNRQIERLENRASEKKIG